ncbi:hypothetical protein [Vibrio coralliilyticus]|uniref:hypothetical protein n=1 Tax=Vibrio coralliilyticus TaxID=190893 RepID=UPI00240A546C|nr:hypothetical protein [Vibrio coralliilyticus]WFB46726.1 hypothetical protein P6988_11355 [Vibrio coralliilyticus]
MGKGGSSSSSNTTQNTNVNGTNAVSGDNLGVLVSGVNKSTINVTATDHGAVKAAANLSEKALASNQETVKEAFSFGEKSLGKALDFGEQSLEAVSANSQSAIDAVKTMAAQSNQNARAALTMAENAKTYEQTGSASLNNKLVFAVSGLIVGGIVIAAIRR